MKTFKTIVANNQADAERTAKAMGQDVADDIRAHKEAARLNAMPTKPAYTTASGNSYPVSYHVTSNNKVVASGAKVVNAAGELVRDWTPEDQAQPATGNVFLA